MGASQSTSAGSSAPTSAVPAGSDAQPQAKHPIHPSQTASEAGGCPVDHSKYAVASGSKQPDSGSPSSEGECPMGHGKSSSPAEPAQECPMGHGKAATSNAATQGPVYNVYGQEVNPDNMMPWLAQKPAPGQKKALSTHRVKSTIPKGGTGSETWLFPSPQQFYNALVRKDKSDNVDEGDIENVVAIHNAMNERAWGLLLDWEKRFHKDDLQPGCPKLRRFMGKPFELSPKARVKALLGLGEPFDRHDWFVDRGDGQEVRYILDYYFDSKTAEVEQDPRGTKCIHVDVRPALDSPSAVLDRLAAFPGRLVDSVTNFRRFVDGSDPDAVPTTVSQALGGGKGRARPVAGADEASTAAERLAAMDRKCNPFKVRLANAEDEHSRSIAFMALTYCMGSVCCKAEADAFLAAAQGSNEDETFQAMHACVVRRVEEDVAAARAEDGRA